MNKRAARNGLILSGVTLGIIATPSYAQDRTQGSGTALEEIVVTATRVETNIQETPMSVTAFSGDDLDLEGIDTGRELGIMVPNLVINPGQFGELATSTLIRGLPGITTYVDGVNFYNIGFLQRSFVEIERVEVLRGPQGTLFGRNSNGGAIQILTRQPADELGGRVDLELGEFDGQAVTLAVDVPLADRWKSKWTAARDKNDGFLESQTAPFSLGHYDNSLLRADFLWEPRDGLSLRFNVNEESRDGSPARIIRVSNPQSPTYIAYNVLAGNPDYLAQARARDPAFPSPPVAMPFDRFTAETHESGVAGGQLGKWETRSDLLGPTVIDQRYAMLTLEWEITAQLSLESLTAYLQSDASQIAPYDGSEFDIVTDMSSGYYEGATQELHLIGNHFNGRLQSLLGLYYNDNSLWERPARWAHWEFAIPNTGPNPGQPGPPGVGGRPHLNQAAVDYVHRWGRTVGNAAVANFTPVTFRTQDQLFHNEWSDRAFFGELTIGLLERLDLTLGFRFTEGESSYAEYLPADAFRPLEPGAEPVGDLYAAAGVIQSTVDNPDFGSISTPKVALAYRLNDDVFLYASHAEGFTQGALVNDPNVGTYTLDPEVVETQEVGLRSDFLDNRLRFNVTLFDSLWDGLRVNKLVALDDTSNGQSFFVLVRTSDGIAQARGLEAELFYLLGERWELDASLGLLDTEYLDIGVPPENGTGLQPGIPLAYAPELSYSLGVRYRLPLSTGGEVLFVGNYGWMDEYQRTAESQFQTKNPDGSNDPEPAYGVLNARIVYQAASGRWQLSLFGTNLANEWYVNGGMEGQTLPAHAGYELATIGRPREVGLGVRFFFD